MDKPLWWAGARGALVPPYLSSAMHHLRVPATGQRIKKLRLTIMKRS